MKNICITGANGFIGKYLCKSLSNNNKNLIGITHSKKSSLNLSKVNYISVNQNWLDINWNNLLKNTEYIIHCAGKAHSFNKKDNFDSYYLANTLVTKNLAEQASKAGIKRFIFLSTVKVNGENTSLDPDESAEINKKKIFTNNDEPDPKDFYAVSKLEAEKILWKIAAKTGLEVVIIRLPLVYGCGVKGNLARLINLIKLGVPLPLNLVKNKRSFIGIDNLVDLINCCMHHPNANGKTLLASDGEDISTPGLIKLIASSMNQKVFLFSVPIFILKFLGFIFGKRQEINRLVGSLRVNISYTKKILNWTPPVKLEEGIKRMIQIK